MILAPVPAVLAPVPAVLATVRAVVVRVRPRRLTRGSLGAPNVPL